MQETYADYDAWKGWGDADFMALTPQQRLYYRDELRGFDLRDRDVLEIGFGSGTFLAWAREQGARLFGTESIPRLTELAAGRDVTVLPIELERSLLDHSGRFGAIVAFDVMEHLTIDENRALLDAVAELLADGGVFVARFPNGQSPLGRAHQHGDLTHRSTLSAGIAAQLLQGRPFDAVHLGNQARARATGLRGLGAGARRLLQRIVEGSIAKIYGTTAPMGPNVVIVLRRQAR